MRNFVDFASAPSEPDFVTALIAERTCSMCRELHASVDEHVCVACNASICADCVRLRPDASVACLRCYERNPVRIFGSATAARTAPAARSAPVASAPRTDVAARREPRGLPAVRDLPAFQPRPAGLKQELAPHEIAELEAAMSLPTSAPRFAVVSSLSASLLAGLRASRVDRASFALVRAAIARAFASLASSLARLGTAMREGELDLEHFARSWQLAYARAAHLGGQLAVYGVDLSRRSLVHARQSQVHVQRFSHVVAQRAAALTMQAAPLRARLSASTHALASRTRGGGLRASGELTHVLREGWANVAQLSERALQATVRAWLALRALPVRHHATAIIVASLILFMIARADHRE